MLKPDQPRHYNIDNHVGARAMVVYNVPLNEVAFDFFDRHNSWFKMLCTKLFGMWRWNSCLSIQLNGS